MLRIWHAGRTIALRSSSKPAASRLQAFRQARGPLRLYADDSNPRPSKPAHGPDPGTTSDPSPTGDGAKPDGTDQGSHENSPADKSQDSFLDAIDDSISALYGKKPLTQAQEHVLYRRGRIPSPKEAEIEAQAMDADEDATEQDEEGSEMPHTSSEASDDIYVDVVDQLPDSPRSAEAQPEDPGHKFGLPEKPYPPNFHLKKRYHPVLNQLTKLIMRDGKLSLAQKNMGMVLFFLRTSPAPIYSPKFPLLPGTPGPWHLSLDPILYLTIAVDSVAPLLSIKRMTGAAGGGRALEIPTPLGLRRRRHMAFQWILDVVKKKPSRGSGPKQFPSRLANEIIAVVEGRSSIWERRRALHKLGTSTRSNIGVKIWIKRKMKK
ncbi:30S ribosomal protein S7 [Ophiocordyceps camponoti-floridani]|uniref:30S ribosomal protein S7 n=1 Tax=Ophiocordyceps camponoti-floridani TaxID=2030778 RepID=A0A8H4VH08_9HYPO|nr:30S ribosomal protein S7 [Ophiocordyceps camponoti-floridani]